MAVYQDFQYYTGGIYEHVWGSFLGYHAIVIVGYGIENGKDYWICKNSWDIDWGENQFGEHIDDPKPGDPDSSNGYFRIAFGECGVVLITSMGILQHQLIMTVAMPNWSPNPMVLWI